MFEISENSIKTYFQKCSTYGSVKKSFFFTDIVEIMRKLNLIWHTWKKKKKITKQITANKCNFEEPQNND